MLFPMSEVPEKLSLYNGSFPTLHAWINKFKESESVEDIQSSKHFQGLGGLDLALIIAKDGRCFLLSCNDGDVRFLQSFANPHEAQEFLKGAPEN